MEPTETRNFYGSVTVSERGQIVIPAGARRQFNIKAGDKLLVFGDLERGLGIATFDIMQKMMQGTADLYREVGATMETPEGKKPKKGGRARPGK